MAYKYESFVLQTCRHKFSASEPRGGICWHKFWPTSNMNPKYFKVVRNIIFKKIVKKYSIFQTKCWICMCQKWSMNNVDTQPSPWWNIRCSSASFVAKHQPPANSPPWKSCEGKEYQYAPMLVIRPAQG
jgi:hypothetical protein